MTLSMFLQSDQELATQLLNAYQYNFKNAIEQTAKGEFLKSSIYLRNAAEFQEQLQPLKDKKQQVDLILKQIEGKWQMDELRRRLGV